MCVWWEVRAMEYVGGGCSSHEACVWRLEDNAVEWILSSFTKVLEIKLKSLEQTHQILFIGWITSLP